MRSTKLPGHEAGNYCVSDDRLRPDPATIYALLSESYRAAVIPQGRVRTAATNSFCIDACSRDAGRVGFARVLTDCACLSFLADVLAQDGHRGLGPGKRLVKAVLEHPALEGAGVGRPAEAIGEVP